MAKRVSVWVSVFKLCHLSLIIFLCNCLAIFLKDSFSINHNIGFLIFHFCLCGLNQKYIKFGP